MYLLALFIWRTWINTDSLRLSDLNNCGVTWCVAMAMAEAWAASPEYCPSSHKSICLSLRNMCSLSLRPNLIKKKKKKKRKWYFQIHNK